MNSSSCNAQIQLRRKNFETKASALPCGGDNHLIKPFLAAARLQAHRRADEGAARNPRRTLARRAHPMRRLLQGDVGSGKTVVAACTALMALESGYNVALMAPTEILAEQHFRNFQKWLEPLGVQVELQTGSRKTVESRESTSREPDAPFALDPRLSHPSTLFIGTHALLDGRLRSAATSAW